MTRMQRTALVAKLDLKILCKSQAYVIIVMHIYLELVD